MEKMGEARLKEIRDVLMKKGFPFEARIARQLGELDFNVSTNGYYLDREEEKGREVDILATKVFRKSDINANADLSLHLVMQCKDTNDVWVLCHYGMETPPTIINKYSAIAVREKSQESKAWLSLYPSPIYNAYELSSFYSVGYVHRTKNDKEAASDIFESSITSVKATNYFKGELVTVTQARREPTVILPIPFVATGNRLISADLSSDKVKIDETSFGILIFRYLSKQYGTLHYPIPVVTEEEIPKVVNGIVDRSKRFVIEYF